MSGSSNFLQFDSTETNISSDVTYSGVTPNGFTTGIASSQIMNKALFQSSTFVAAFGQVLANLGYTISDNSISGVEAAISSALTFTGRLINIQKFTTSGTYTPTNGMSTAIIEVQGAGGAGGGCPATGPSTISIGVPGSAGAYAKGRYTAVEIGASQAITVGAGGSGVVGATGGGGGTSSFGSLINSPGGLGGVSVSPISPPYSTIGAGPSPAPIGGNIYQVSGGSGDGSFMISNLVGLPGIGGPSIMGGNEGYGSGGSGEALGISSAAVAGAGGGAGIVIIYEYA